MYKLKTLPPAKHFFKKVREKGLRDKFESAINDILVDPYIGELKTGDLSGIYSLDVYYQKTNYEIAYRIYDEIDKLVVVILAGTRENFYNELKRYLN